MSEFTSFMAKQTVTPGDLRAEHSRAEAAAIANARWRSVSPARAARSTTGDCLLRDANLSMRALRIQGTCMEEYHASPAVVGCPPSHM